MTTVRFYALNDENARSFYDEWKFKTLALIRKRGWGLIFDDATVTIPTTAQVSADSATAAQKKIYKQNVEAYDQILMGCSGVPLGLVKRASGNARQAIENLDMKYAKRTAADLTMLLNEFTNCKLASLEDDPDKWFLKLDGINEKLREINVDYVKKPYEIKAQMLGGLPAGYEDVRTKLSGNEDMLSLADIEREIRDKWKRQYLDKGGNTAANKDNMAMHVEKGASVRKGTSFFKKFKGRCRKCGKQGHKASDCKSDKKGVCFNCGEDGHFARSCPKKAFSKPAKEGSGMFVGMAECGMTASSNNTEFVEFLLDSGASCHVIGNGDMLVYPEMSKETIKVGDGTTLKASKQGTLLLETEGGATIKLERVQVVPGMVKNIISTGCIAKAGNKVVMEGTQLTVTNLKGKSFTAEMDERSALYHLKARMMWHHEVNSILTQSDNMETGAAKDKEVPVKKKFIDINDAHELYGHLNYGLLKPMLQNRGYVVVDNGKNKWVCEPCAYAKARAKNNIKETLCKASAKGERLFMDISGPYKMALTGNKFWVLIVDDFTRKAWSFFVKSKKESKRVVDELLTLLRGARVTTKYLRCDNAGENIKGLKELCDANGIQLELTAPYTPQMNGVVERKFVTIRDRAQSMMLGAMLDEEHQGKLWAEATYTATRLHNLVPNSRGKAPDELWYGQLPEIVDHLVKWGRIGYVKIRDTVTRKLEKKSIKMVFMGYSANHPADTYRMYNPATGKVIHTRDVTWADWHGGQVIPDSLKMFAKDMRVNTRDEIIDDEGKLPALPTTVHADGPDLGDDIGVDVLASGAGRIDDELGRTNADDDAPQANDMDEVADIVPVDDGAAHVVADGAGHVQQSRLARELARLNTSYNPTVTIEDNDSQTEQRDQLVQVHYVFNADLASDPGEPKTFGEALDSKDRMKWIDAIKKEIENFMTRDAWKPVPLSHLRAGQRPISVKWIFKKKNEQDGSVRYKARVCVRGFVQIPGVDFNLTHSPVATEVSIRLVLAITLAKDDEGWDAHMLDIEAAFLEAKLDEDVYIEWPPGVVMMGFVPEDETKGKCLKLERAMYGAVQSPLAFWKECAAHLDSIGMTKSQADPCVWFKLKGDETWLIVAVYVDDIVYCGTTEARQWFKGEIEKRFKIVDLGSIKKHLGVWYERKRDDKGLYFELTMNKYLEDITNDWVMATGRQPKQAATPGYPGETLSKNLTDETIQIEDYRKILGKLMWFTKKTMPECGNAIRELASHMDKPADEHWRAMERVVGYINRKGPSSLKLRKPRDFKCYAYVDSNFATNKDNRKSITGYVITLGGCIVSWSSKTQPSVTLSSTEAEYVAASTCATEIKFIQMVLEEIVPSEAVRPATLFEDNTGAIYLMENQAVGNRTKHIDIRMHHIREMMQGTDPRMRVMFTRSESNFADVLTKNVTEQTFTQLVPSLKNGDIAEVIFQTVNREDVKKRGHRVDRQACRRVESQQQVTDVSTVEKYERDAMHDQGVEAGWTLVKFKGIAKEKEKSNGADAGKHAKWEAT